MQAMYRFLQSSCALLLATICSGYASAQLSADKPLDELRSAGIDPTREGIDSYLRGLVEGKQSGVSDKEAATLIAELGHKQFKVREAATKRLVGLHLPPFAQLQEAARSNDPEIARRARTVLDQIEAQPDIPALVCSHIQRAKLTVSATMLLRALALFERPAAEHAAQDAFAAVARTSDKEAIGKALSDPNPRVKAAAVRVLALIQKDPDAELQKYLKDKEPRVRLAAARGLADRATHFDFSAYTKVLDADSLVLLLRAAERRFRQLHEAQLTDGKVMGEYNTLIEQYVAALTAAKRIVRTTKPATGDDHWVKQGLDTSKHPELLMYRIRWFNGQWSAWFVPGFNDRELNTDRTARYWGCFADHEHEMVTTQQSEFYREISDLKKIK